MIVKTIGSGSSGNGYALISGGDIFLLECGVPAKEMLKAIDYQTSRVVGCIAMSILITLTLSNSICGTASKFTHQIKCSQISKQLWEKEQSDCNA